MCGDDVAQRNLRFCMLHLMSAAPRHSDRLSVPCKLLTGEYNFRNFIPTGQLTPDQRTWPQALQALLGRVQALGRAEDIRVNAPDGSRDPQCARGIANISACDDDATIFERRPDEPKRDGNVSGRQHGVVFASASDRSDHAAGVTKRAHLVHAFVGQERRLDP